MKGSKEKEKEEKTNPYTRQEEMVGYVIEDIMEIADNDGDTEVGGNDAQNEGEKGESVAVAVEMEAELKATDNKAAIYWWRIRRNFIEKTTSRKIRSEVKKLTNRQTNLQATSVKEWLTPKTKETKNEPETKMDYDVQDQERPQQPVSHQVNL